MSHWNTHPHVRTGSDLSLGERAADKVRAGLGSWRFIFAQTIIVAAWVIMNVWGVTHHWDPYPFILLNLAFSTQAAYAAPVLQLSNNRNDRISSEVAVGTHRMAEDLLELNKRQMEILTELRQLRAAVEDKTGSEE